jgi:hypothetical protein
MDHKLASGIEREVFGAVGRDNMTAGSMTEPAEVEIRTELESTDRPRGRQRCPSGGS